MAPQKFTPASTITLSNGTKIPQIQLGLYLVFGQALRDSVGYALDAGYRGFDCAQYYENEKEAGDAIRDYLESDRNTSRLTREDIWYTTKIKQASTSYNSLRQSVKESVQLSGLGYVDLFLIHSPQGGKDARLTTWRALEDAIDDGEIKMAGISNFTPRHIEELMASNPRFPPVVNQVELHPFNTQDGIRQTCAKHNIHVQAYSPLAKGMRFEHPKIVALAKKYSCSAAQIFVRWSLQHDLITLPKSSNKDRLIENSTVDWFEILEEDMNELDNIGEYLVTDEWDPEKMD